MPLLGVQCFRSFRLGPNEKQDVSVRDAWQAVYKAAKLCFQKVFCVIDDFRVVQHGFFPLYLIFLFSVFVVLDVDGVKNVVFLVVHRNIADFVGEYLDGGKVNLNCPVLLMYPYAFAINAQFYGSQNGVDDFIDGKRVPFTKEGVPVFIFFDGVVMVGKAGVFADRQDFFYYGTGRTPARLSQNRKIVDKQ